MQTFSSLSAVFLYKYHKSCGCGESIRGLQNLGASFSKGFNLFCAKGLFGCADSRFAEPRYSLQRERVVTFCVVQKVTKKHAGLRPATSIQISVRFGAFTEMTDQHQVTGYGENRRASGYRR